MLNPGPFLATPGDVVKLADRSKAVNGLPVTTQKRRRELASIRKSLAK